MAGADNMYFGAGTQNPTATSATPGIYGGPVSSGGSSATPTDAPTTYPSTTGPSSDQASAKALIDSTLAAYGLGDLGTWAWNRYLAGAPIDQIMLELRQQPTYQARFPGMADLAKKGMAISETDYVNLERTYSQLLHSAGLPASFYDQPGDFTNWIVGNVSPTEVADRINRGYLQVTQAPKEVRDAFAQYFGPSGDAALAAFFLDPDKAVPALEKMATTAIVGGTAARFGYNFDVNQSGRLADLGVTADQAQQGFIKLGALHPLFDPTISEQDNLHAGEQGLNAVFGLDATSQFALDKRLQERKAQFAGDPNAGPQLTSTGSSIGSART